MQEQIMRRLFLGFINIHILYYAQKKAFYGSWMIEELKKHGYDISAGTLYPMLHNMGKYGLLNVEDKNIDGRLRKYYSITHKGKDVFKKAKEKAYELLIEID